MYLITHDSGRFIRWLDDNEIITLHHLRKGKMLPARVNSEARELMEEMRNARMVLVCNCRAFLAPRLKAQPCPDGLFLEEISGCGKHDESCPLAPWVTHLTSNHNPLMPE